MQIHRIVMLVNNDWKIDSRVRREARALAEAGHEVHVVCRHGNAAARELHEGVTFHTLPAQSPRPIGEQYARLLRLHLGILARCARTPGLLAVPFRQALAALFAAIGLVAAIPVLLPLAALLFLLRRRPVLDRVRRLKAAGVGTGFIATVGRLVGAASTLLVRIVQRGMAPMYAEYLHYLNGFGVEARQVAVGLKPTVVHSHDLTTLSTGHAVARTVKCPLLYDAHELETHTNYWGLAPATKRWIAIYEKALIGQASAVVTVCDSIADWLQQNYRISRPTVVLNSPDLQHEAARAPTTIRERLALDARVPLAVYVGSVTTDRGMVQCVQATALVPGLHFAFVGPRYSVTEGEIREHAHRLGVSDRIHLVDPVPSREVASFVSSADCSVIAIQNVCLSYYFCFPNKLLESVIGGVPVAAARLVELEKFIGRFKVGVIMDETDPASIAEAIGKVLADPGRYRPSPEILQSIRDEYGWPAQVRRLRALYASLPQAATA